MAQHLATITILHCRICIICKDLDSTMNSIHLLECTRLPKEEHVQGIKLACAGKLKGE